MSSLISAELVATCNALGYFDVHENKYYADENTLETVKDLIRYLRRDDQTHDIRRQLGETKVIQTDILPLLKNYWEEIELFDVLLRLLVNLTTPALMLWNEEFPVERIPCNQYLQIEEHLRLYKQAFADEALWAVLSTRISKILEVDSKERGDDNGLIIERILILIRNILYVPADPEAEKRPDNDASVHDQVLWALHQSGMLDIILYITSSTTEHAYYMHVLEILSLMLREQNATELANVAIQRSQTEKMRDEAELLAIRHRENHQKVSKLKKYNGARHSRFGGTFVVKSFKSISDNELICHKPLNRVDGLDFDVDKTKSKTPKNRRPVQADPAERRSAFSIRLFLKEFCVEFLKGAYNTTMYHAKNKLSRARTQQHDESYYLWAIRFFMEFNRCHKFEVKLVSETMSVQTFHFVQLQMEKYFDMISSDKKKLRLWSRRLHLALLAYRELLLTIFTMDKSQDVTVRDSAKVIKSNIFYVQEYRELILTLLVTYDELKMSPTYLQDLIETQHIFLKMLESYCGGKCGQVVVQRKSTVKRKRKENSTDLPLAISGLNLNSMWEEASSQLSIVLEGILEIPNDIVPFDTTSDVGIDEQKLEAMQNIQRMLWNHEFEKAVILLRVAREVWPENDSFGTVNMVAVDEFSSLRDIFFADLGGNGVNMDKIEGRGLEEEDSEEDADREMEKNMNISESDLKFDEFCKRLANPKIVRSCGLALANFDRNSTITNHCIIKLLHRIAYDCKMSMMMFQVSIFRTFQRIYEAKDLPQTKELVNFATYIIRNFFQVANKNSNVFMEALFWKNSKDAYDISEGYGSYQEKSKAASQAWTELEEDELRKLFIEHRDNNIGEDVIDWILNNLINNTRNRRSILKKLKQMYLLVDYNRTKSCKAMKHWGHDEEAQLCELYEEFKDAMDPLAYIMDRLELKRPKNRIVEKLIVMGLIHDKKDLCRKQKKKIEKERYLGVTEKNNARTTLSSKQSFNQTAKREKIMLCSNQDSRELARTLIRLVQGGGFDAALEWLKESFIDAAEDYEMNNVGIPLVPIMDPAIEAMENKKFQKLLLQFGIEYPSNEQEAYWRIPSTFSKNILKGHCDMITKALNKTLDMSDESTLSPTKTQMSCVFNDFSDDDILEKKHNTEPKNKDNSEFNNKDVMDHTFGLEYYRTKYKQRNLPILLKIAEIYKKRTKNLSTPAVITKNNEHSLLAADKTEDNNLSFIPSRILNADSDQDTLKVNSDTEEREGIKRNRSESNSESEQHVNIVKKIKRIIYSDED